MINKIIKKLRKENNLSLRALAEKAGISKSTLSDIENNNVNPTTTTLQKIAIAFNMTLSELMSIKFDAENDTSQLKEEINLYETGEFKTPEAAMKFILKQPSLMNYGGYDIKNMSNKDIIELANDLLKMFKIISSKYKK
ncbi:helix-turn-helix domain-containing protein [Clostridium tyrobutyricum]|uniref:helix-turn-helix domain-containing protein n=1 Tax=Clostridium tyrobutyricum TaxID=1519 RepID=UPI001C39071B|nr:helix-turn-helix transcriptional regulator [Clostridium tyrobutyricum]MBV4429402.1 helix-turn-helix transcriptional regulator [Clostridium tyrobutyricum]MBV4443029.1 helix-turn-helix transcriptional regulator [Clostridium tyrobutyricum]